MFKREIHFCILGLFSFFSAASQESGSKSGANSLVQGFHYRLKKNFQVEYAQQSVTNTTLKGAPSCSCYTYKHCYNIVTFRSPDSTQDKYMNHEIVDSVSDSCVTVVMPGNCCDSAILQKNTTIIRDLTNRYWLSPTGVLAKKKLNVAAIQNDSGKIIIQLPRRSYEAVRSPVSTVQIIPSAFAPAREYLGAIPIQGLDSVNNFFLQLVTKQTVNQPVSYLSLHYRT
ncbi:MAG: hypothetical protein KGO82_19590, partial [Bacteroidota bacterium]|nr:hypothetical protein [Bacteroidota bacterium]